MHQAAIDSASAEGRLLRAKHAHSTLPGRFDPVVFRSWIAEGQAHSGRPGRAARHLRRHGPAPPQPSRCAACDGLDAARAPSPSRARGRGARRLRAGLASDPPIARRPRPARTRWILEQQLGPAEQQPIGSRRDRPARARRSRRCSRRCGPPRRRARRRVRGIGDRAQPAPRGLLERCPSVVQRAREFVVGEFGQRSVIARVEADLEAGLGSSRTCDRVRRYSGGSSPTSSASAVRHGGANRRRRPLDLRGEPGELLLVAGAQRRRTKRRAWVQAAVRGRLQALPPEPVRPSSPLRSGRTWQGTRGAGGAAPPPRDGSRGRRRK